jgi:hypothetical protein
MSKEAGLTGMSDLGKTMGEQSGSAKTHLDAVTVNRYLSSKYILKLIKFTKFSAKISLTLSLRWQS